MYTLKSQAISLLCLLGCATVAKAQHGTKADSTGAIARVEMITGSIKDAATGKPLGSVRITYGNLYAAITDSLGHFSMRVPDTRASVHAEADGYQSMDIALKGLKNVQAALYDAAFASPYDDVALPFGPVVQSRSTLAATSVETNGSWGNILESPDSYLQGKVAGLQAVRRSGTPGIGANLFLRGYSSLYATNQPLLVVDGILYDNSDYGQSLLRGHYQNPLSFIDMKDIDNVSVIKDGASTYGTKGANGVIIITTSRARQEATKIEAAIYGGINAAPGNIPVMNAADYRIYLAEMLQSKGLSAAAVRQLPYMNDDSTAPGYYKYHSSNDWQKKVLGNSQVRNGYLKITGGDNIAMYALTMGVLKNEGIIRGTTLSRYNTRFNADLNLSKRLTADANLSFTYSEQNLRNTGGADNTNPVYTALVKSPFLATNEVDEKGTASPTLADKDIFNVSNPAALIESMQGINRSYRFVGSINFNYELSDHFALSSGISVTMNKMRESFFIPQNGIVADTLINGIAFNRSAAQVLRLFNINNDTRLTYLRTFSRKHQFDARLGVRYTQSKAEQDQGFGYNAATDQLTGVGNGLPSLRQIGGSLGEWRWWNTYLHAGYNFLNKYFLALDMAADGSSRFGNETGYAFMPSVSGAWLISSENFLAGSRVVSLMKLRASVSKSGNDDVGNFTAKKYYVSQNLLGIQGLVRGNIGNAGLQWETVTRLNAGLDAGFFHDRLKLTVDLFSSKTDHMIVYEPALTATGMEYTVTNSGAMKTTGIEGSFNLRLVNQRNLKWDAGFTIAHNKTIVTKLPSGNILTNFADGTFITSVGAAPNLFYGYKTNGIFITGAEAATAGLLNRNPNGSGTAFQGGDVRFVNSNGSDNMIDQNDRQVIGDPNPDFFGSFSSGLTYRNWSLDLLFTFSQGNDVYNYTRRQLESMQGYQNQTIAVVNRWRTDGQQTSIPKATWNDPLGNSRFSDRWIEDGSYLRLRSLSIAYQVPVKPRLMKSLAVYLSANNLLTFTKYKGYDPEFSVNASLFGQGVDYTEQPQFRTLLAGVKIGL